MKNIKEMLHKVFPLGEGPGDDNSGLGHSGWGMAGRWFGSRQILALLLTRHADLGNRR